MDRRQCRPEIRGWDRRFVQGLGHAVEQSHRGAGIYNRDGEAQLTHCTFANNTAFDGGAVANIDSILGIHNSILWGNTPNELAWYSNGDIQVRHSDVTGGHAGPGNLDADPLFVAAAAGELHLAARSPCIDAGDADYATAKDLEGNGRVDDPATVDGSACIAPCADLGAFEFQPLR
jgi:hypothetical protein